MTSVKQSIGKKTLLRSIYKIRICIGIIALLLRCCVSSVCSVSNIGSQNIKGFELYFET